MFRCRSKEDSIVWPNVWRGAALAHDPWYFPSYVLACAQPEIVKAGGSQKLPGVMYHPIDSARSRCIKPETLIELPSVETFPGAACLPRHPAALDFKASQREIPHSRSKAAPLQALGGGCTLRIR
jgi:hypothetical protein